MAGACQQMCPDVGLPLLLHLLPARVEPGPFPSTKTSRLPSAPLSFSSIPNILGTTGGPGADTLDPKTSFLRFWL